MVHYAFVQKRKSIGIGTRLAGNAPRRKSPPELIDHNSYLLKAPSRGQGRFFCVKSALCSKILHIFRKFCAIYINFPVRLDFWRILRYTVTIMIYPIKALKLKIIKAIKYTK